MKRVKFFLLDLAGKLIALLLICISKTWRVAFKYKSENFDPYEKAVFTFWHAWILTLFPLHRKKGAVILASRSSDGHIAAGALGFFRGYDVVRGSSSRGGLDAFYELLRAIKKGKRVGIPADGPKGPAGRVKRGAVLLAKRAGESLIPVEVRAHPLLRFSSWDRTALPLPFARVEVIYHEPIRINEVTQELLNKIEESMGAC